MIETSIIYGREILHGIADYLRVHGDWSVYLDEREASSEPPDWFADWDGDGVICRWTCPKLREQLRARNLAVIDLNDRHGYLGLTRVGSDMHAIGRMAAEHLMERGFSNIAFCGYDDRFFSVGRREGVMAAVSEKGHFAGAFESSMEGLRQRSFDEEQQEIGRWLKELPRPLGVVACNDVRGYHVLDACRAFGFFVPEEVAVVGVDNAETFCEFCHPPLSSVVPNAQRIGFTAADLLDRIMSGERSEPQEILVPPCEIITRQSSDVLAIGNVTVARAVAFIRQNAARGLRVEEVLAHMRVPRPMLERSFRQVLGRSPQEEIRRVRLKRVKDLLMNTDWTLERVAEETGFEHPEYMMVQFKRMVGQTPGRWRAEHQAGMPALGGWTPKPRANAAARRAR